jgi:hypothetical protein
MESAYATNLVLLRNLEPALDMTDPRDYPLLKAVGLSSFPYPIDTPVMEWQIDYLPPIVDALNGAISSTSVSTLTVDHAEYFRLHEMIKIDSELMRVLSIDATNNTLTVERGFAGSTAATHSDDAVIDMLGAARPEGSSPGWGVATTAVQPWNVCQIFDGTVAVTGTEANTRYYGVDNVKAYRMEQEMASLWMRMEKALMYNLRYKPSTNVGRVTGGLAQFVHDENAMSDAILTYSDFIDALTDVYKRAGMSNMPLDAWLNADAKNLINTWGEAGIRIERTEDTYGSMVDQIATNYGTVRFHLDHLVATDDIWLLNMPRIQIGSYAGRPMGEYDASVPGEDAVRTRVLGEYGFAVKGEDGINDGLHVRISGFSTS